LKPGFSCLFIRFSFFGNLSFPEGRKFGNYFTHQFTGFAKGVLTQYLQKYSHQPIVNYFTLPLRSNKKPWKNHIKY